MQVSEVASKNRFRHQEDFATLFNSPVPYTDTSAIIIFCMS